MSSLDAKLPTLSPRELLTLRFLEAHEAPCPACGYNVHKATLPRCPECGRALTLRLTTPAPRAPASWVLLMTATSLSAGMGLFILAIILRERMPPDLSWRIVLIYFVCTIPSPLIAFFVRRMMSLHRTFALALSTLTALLTLIMFTWFLIRIIYR